MFQLPQLYNEHLKKEFNSTQYLILLILINFMQNLKTVRLEELARRFPHPILLRSRIKKLQRFLSLPQFQINSLWFPILQGWIEGEFEWGEIIYIVIDRSQWRSINLLMVTLVYDHRAIPIYFCLLRKRGSSNLAEQQKVLKPFLELLKKYKIVVLGDREFCSVELAKWLHREKKVYLSLRLKKNEYVELEKQFWFQLRDLGLSPGTSLYYQGVKVTKTKGFAGLNLAAKWRRKYKDTFSKEPWYILTNLENLSDATSAYSKRMGIEEMFRDLKLGGYDLEGTQVTDERLISIILLITLAYCYSTFSGATIKRKGVTKYVTRPTEPQRNRRRHSSFSIGLNSFNWLDSLAFFKEEMEQLMAFCPHKQAHYQRGIRAASLIQSAF